MGTALRMPFGCSSPQIGYDAQGNDGAKHVPTRVLKTIEISRWSMNAASNMLSE
jgi:hypothetical protein